MAFRHAHHEFPMSIKAVVFDAYWHAVRRSVSSRRYRVKRFPAMAKSSTQIWRIKQLEYTWLRSLMQRYQDFSAITR